MKKYMKPTICIIQINSRPILSGSLGVTVSNEDYDSETYELNSRSAGNIFDDE